MRAARLTLSRFVGNIAASIDWISGPFLRRLPWRRADAAPRFHRGLTAWTTALRRGGVLTIELDVSPRSNSPLVVAVVGRSRRPSKSCDVSRVAVPTAGHSSSFRQSSPATRVTVGDRVLHRRDRHRAVARIPQSGAHRETPGRADLGRRQRRTRTDDRTPLCARPARDVQRRGRRDSTTLRHGAERPGR